VGLFLAAFIIWLFLRDWGTAVMTGLVVPVTMVVYPRQPHGIQEPKLMQDAMQRNLDWFDQWIKGTQVTKEGHYLFTPK
jgi:hypothetical protein